ncbi:hypothetical protein [Kitasatospora sp. NPDC087315]|uniref:hypothetical protein n=1 Tax=Kitasatospora sp. NPDC087315 TaxID=3364069 RepID=UPI003827A805
MHTTTVRERALKTALTALAEPGNPGPADDYGHGLEAAKAAILEALTDHPDPERSLRNWAARSPAWQGHGHQAGYAHIQQETRLILDGDQDTVLDYLTPNPDDLAALARADPHYRGLFEPDTPEQHAALVAAGLADPAPHRTASSPWTRPLAITAIGRALLQHHSLT